MAKYKRKTEFVEAIQHDGTDESADKLAAWVNAEGGKAVPVFKGTIDYAQNNAFIKIDSHRPQNLVGPNGWVVQVRGSVFYAITDEDFRILYRPVESRFT